MPRGWSEALGRLDMGDLALACAVTEPHEARRAPAVVLLPPLGARARAGPLDAQRDGIAALLRAFADAGFATLRVDPCGVGESGGPAYAEASLAIEIEGYRAAIDAAAALASVDPELVFVLGVSLGGALAPIVAEGARLAGVIVYGAPSRRWSACLADTAARQAALAGLPPDEAERAARLYDRVITRGESPRSIAASAPDLMASAAARDLTDAHLHGRALHYFRALDRVDPERAWAAVRAPVLAVRGEHDFIVADDDHARVAAFVTRGGGRARAVEIAGLDHDMRRRASRAEAFAARGGGELDPSLARAMIAWIEAESKRP